MSSQFIPPIVSITVHTQISKLAEHPPLLAVGFFDRVNEVDGGDVEAHSASVQLITIRERTGVPRVAFGLVLLLVSHSPSEPGSGSKTWSSPRRWMGALVFHGDACGESRFYGKISHPASHQYACTVHRVSTVWKEGNPR